MSPGLTTDLPGSLIEDLTSTSVGPLVIIDQARVDAVNNVTPYGSNAYILAQQGLQFGLPQGLNANGSAFVVFTGSPAYVIPPGFIVSDGTYQYVVKDGGTVSSGGTSEPLFVVATNSSTFPIAPNTINVVVTPVTSPFTLTVTNPEAGIPALAPETTPAYRSRLLQAWNPVQGVMSQVKTRVLAVPGVSPRLVSVRQAGTLWEVICGGGDPYQVAGAIYQGAGYIGVLTGSPIDSARNITVTLFDSPDYYDVVFVNPPQQVLTFAIVWNTTLPNFTASGAVNQYMIAAAQAYGNSIIVGQPVNLMVLNQQLQASVASVLAPENLTTLEVTVTINGVEQSPTAGTSIIPSDVESYFYISPTGATAVQG